MKNIRKETIYQGVILFMMMGFIIFFDVSHKNFMDLLNTNEKLTTLNENKEILMEQLETNFEKLQLSYSQLSEEKYELECKLREVEIPVYNFTEEEIYLLARCVEAEAGDYDNHKLSQQYVAQVILNRLHSGKFPNTIEEVIYQKRGNIPQFSVAYNGAIDREVDERTLTNVYNVIVHGTDLPEYVYYFYSESVTKNWVNTLNIYSVVQGTVFAYSDKEVTKNE